jgi:tRNA-2-methylthio-N6-dimethylallyladenosine synthase
MARGLQKEKSVFIDTFGCQMNEDDSDRLFSFLKDIDFTKTDEPESADLIIVNTCSIRDKAEQKVYSTVGRFKALKKKNPGLIIGISGCVAQQEGATLLKRIPHLDMVIGTHNIHRIAELLKQVSLERKRVVANELTDTILSGEYLPRSPEVKRKKTFVSIMRGCNNFCSYCIVPYVRGREVSRPSSEVIEEVEILAANGTREVTLLGQNVNSYGLSARGGGEDITFPVLLRRVCRVAGIERVRFVTSHPKDISIELISLFGEEPKLCRNIHLPLQSGSDRVLERMKRCYTVEEYLSKVSLLKKLYPDISISTDIIVGFPGEEKGDFEGTMEVVKKTEFDSMFSFKYSPRPGTLAATFKDQVPEGVKSRRLEILQSVQRDITIKKNKSLEGNTVEVLVEGRSKAAEDELTGRAPSNRVVNFPGDPALVGSVIDVLITQAYSNSLRAIPIERSLICY